ncbi:MAG TPA: ATP-binding protein, partial [Anaerolineaceae bacterium]|nr:ATP-binding protein [Anaerolineaceae bacterium]
LETILDQVQDGVIVVDQDNEVLLVNPMARAILKEAVDDPTGQPIDEVVAQPELLELVHNPDLRLMKRLEITVADGRIFGIQLTPVADLGQVISFHDITYLKKLDSLKSEFVSTVSHDLRSPLTAILGYIELIRRVGPINELQSQYIERVQVSIRNITSLVDDLLNLGRIEAGLDARQESVFLDLILQQSIDNLKNQAAHQELKVSADIEEDLPQVFGNPLQLRQMVDNLIDNAAKYTPDGGEIKVSLAKNSSQVILKITDTGPCIPPGDLPYVFDKFYRAANVTPETTGTGLGLSIVKSIVESHHGSIWVDSVLDKGSTFTVVLPIAA